MSVQRQRNLWRTGFLGVTALAVVMELVASFDKNPNTDPWTDLITAYVPWQVGVAAFGALLLWVPVHFIHAYQVKRRKAAVDELSRADLSAKDSGQPSRDILL